jgi:hypothetical protein
LHKTQGHEVNDQTPIVDPFQWWRRACTEPHLIGKPELPIHDGHPQCGYYRRKTARKGPWEPAAIWQDAETGETLAITGFAGKEREHHPDDLWTWVAKNPISYEMYAAAFETGRWPDEGSSTVDDEPAPMGDNSRELTPQEKAEADIRSALADAAVWLKKIGKAAPVTQLEADTATNLAGKVHTAAKAAEKVHETLKAPHLKAERALDAWKRDVCGPQSAAAKAKTELLAKVTIFQNAERARLEAERRKAQEEAEAKARAERQRQMDEINAIAAAKAIEAAATLKAEEAALELAKINDEANKAAQAVAVEVKAEPVKIETNVKTGGAFGRKASGREIWTATITDYAKALAAAADTDEVRAAVQLVANRRMNSKPRVDMAGVEYASKMEARL